MSRYALLFLMGVVGVSLVWGQGHSDALVVSEALEAQVFPQIEYNPVENEYLAVWEDSRDDRSDIYGQFIHADGTLKGDNFAVCSAPGPQYWPRMAFDPDNNRFLVVFEDWREAGKSDISGVFVNHDGSFYEPAGTDEYHSFAICSNDSNIYTCSVAFNTRENVFLAVWGDFRNEPEGENSWTGADVFGQLITADGELINPADPTVNIPVAAADWTFESVPDVTYNHITNEFFVVYGTSFGRVLGQRVDHSGQLIQPDGSVLAKTGGAMSVLPAMMISGMFNNGPDCFQARVASRTEFHANSLQKAASRDTTEMQVVWKGMTNENDDNEIWGQRIGFARQDEGWAAFYIDKDGAMTESVSSFIISEQMGWPSPPDLAYGQYDDEYLVGWGNYAEFGVNADLYAQRLGINPVNELLLLDDDQIGTVSATETIPIDTSIHENGGIGLGVAHNSKTNEFLMVYNHADTSDRDQNIYAIRFFGSHIPQLAQVQVSPSDTFCLTGESVQFTGQAFDDLGDAMDVPLVWSAKGGSIDSAGFYTAGDTPGTYTITATDEESGIAGIAEVTVSWPAGVADRDALPREFLLYANYPNPFNASTVIAYDLPITARVEILIYNISGKTVNQYLLGDLPAGTHRMIWDGVDQKGQPLSSGTYLIHLRANNYQALAKAVLLR
ncbi:MAG: FlgD immunoglobulin-like domain containing protein [candidate division KSB1 bacterium]|nr:FlgD immunoglobulin-like domain containing protein [candidate division KSB1 bacterium]